VLPGVHRIPLPLPTDGLRAVNVYALEVDEGLVLVDGGWALPESRALLGRALEELGRDLREVQQVLVTHIHRDHYTQAVTLREEFGTSVRLGIGEIPSMRRLLDDRGSVLEERARLLRLHGAFDLAAGLVMDGRSSGRPRPRYEEPDEWLAPGPISVGGLTLEAVSTPGHTQGHMVFHDTVRGVLFAGDHVLPHITPSIGFEPTRPEFPLQDYLGSLRRVLELPDADLLPAHGPAGGSSHARVHELLDHHERRLRDTFDAVLAGASTAVEVARVLRWTGRGRALSELDEFDRVLAVLETAAHLDVLVLRGELNGLVEEHLNEPDDELAPLRRYLLAMEGSHPETPKHR
jgi:glyoxylase-like metal-dependent hydrolase (beta-lactamase superfamily II)